MTTSARELTIDWTKPALGPAISTRLTKQATARIELLSLQSGNTKGVIMRELIVRGWKSVFGDDLDAPF